MQRAVIVCLRVLSNHRKLQAGLVTAWQAACNTGTDPPLACCAAACPCCRRLLGSTAQSPPVLVPHRCSCECSSAPHLLLRIQHVCLSAPPDGATGRQAAAACRNARTQEPGHSSKQMKCMAWCTALTHSHCMYACHRDSACAVLCCRNPITNRIPGYIRGPEDVKDL